jgi:hypothetical protein
LRPGAVQGNVGWGEDPTQATAMPVTPPDPGRALRAAPIAGLHTPERNPVSRFGMAGAPA